MSLRTILAILSALVISSNLIVSAAVAYHLRKYTLPGWTFAKTAVPIYTVCSFTLILLAIYFLLGVPTNLDLGQPSVPFGTSFRP